MKVVKALIVVFVIGFLASSCNRVKCPTNTFSQEEIKAQQIEEEKI